MAPPPAPTRDNFQDQETYEEALGFWRSRVGRFSGMRGVSSTAASPASPEVSPVQRQATLDQQNE